MITKDTKAPPIAFAAALFMGLALAGCSGSVDAVRTPSQTSPSSATTPAPTGSGTLVVSVSDPEGRALDDAAVDVFNPTQTVIIGSARTGTTGVASIDAVPATVLVYVHHSFGESYRNQDVAVAQQGVTQLAVTLEPSRPKPTVALLPASIPAESVSADRSELTLRITLVAPAAAPFVPAGYGDYSAVATPSLGLALGKFEDIDTYATPRQCFVWLDRGRTAPSCGTPWGETPYTVSVLKFDYDPFGAVPLLAVPGRARSAMLVMDQADRVAELDPGARRSFAVRRFIARALDSSGLEGLSVAGIARDGNAPAGPAALPEQPLWVPLSASAVFSTDRVALDAAVSILEPLVGGSAPVFEGLEAALALTARRAPPGNRAVIAMLGGGDSDVSESARLAALASLRQQRDDTQVQSVLIAAAPVDQSGERWALAELAAALRAPTISLGASQTWGAGAFAAWDLAGDLLDGLPLRTLSAEFRVKTNQPDGFRPRTTLHGIVYVESNICPMGCWEMPLEFAAEIP